MIDWYHSLSSIHHIYIYICMCTVYLPSSRACSHWGRECGNRHLHKWTISYCILYVWHVFCIYTVTEYRIECIEPWRHRRESMWYNCIISHGFFIFIHQMFHIVSTHQVFHIVSSEPSRYRRESMWYKEDTIESMWYNEDIIWNTWCMQNII